MEAGLRIVTVASSAIFTAFLAVSRSSLIFEPIKGREVADFHLVSSRSALSSFIDASTVMISASAASASPFVRYSIVCLTDALSILASDAAFDAFVEYITPITVKTRSRTAAIRPQIRTAILGFEPLFLAVIFLAFFAFFSLTGLLTGLGAVCLGASSLITNLPSKGSLAFNLFISHVLFDQRRIQNIYFIYKLLN